jgi:hypothetical protein
MLEHNASAFLTVLEKLTQLECWSAWMHEKQKGSSVSMPYIDKILSTLDELKAHCTDLNIPLSVAQIERIRTTLPRSTGTMESKTLLLSSLRDRIKDELDAKMFLTLDAGRATLYRNTGHFGPDVGGRFPTALFDIDEASKCISLSRYTACVFHLMRSMEILVKEFASHFSVTINPKDVWGVILGNVKNAIASMPQSTQAEIDKRRYFDEAAAHLHHIKEAWRNTTMHVEKTYTEEEAKSIFDGVEAFAKRLATLI